MSKENKATCIELQKRISIIKASIYDVFFSSNDPEHISFNLILNRILILIQQPITFVIYKKRSNGKYIRRCNFMRDKAHESEFLKYLQSNEDGCFYIKNYEWLFDTYSDKYKIAVYKVVRGKEKNTIFDLLKNNELLDIDLLDDYLNSKIDCKDNKVTYKDDNDKECRYNYIKYLLTHVFKGNYSNEFIEYTENSIKSLNFSKNRNNDIIETNFNDINFNCLKQVDCLKQDFKEEINNKINRVFIKIHKATKIINSLCVKEKNEHGANDSIFNLSNVLFFVRDYSNISIYDNGFKLNKRFINSEQNIGYDYNIRTVISKNQEEEIRNYFKRLNKDALKKHTCDLSKGKAMSIIDSWFWTEKENKSEEEFLNTIIELLSQDTYVNVKSFSDPVFQNGLVHFRRPFLKELDIVGLDNINEIEKIEDIDKNKLDFCKKQLLIYYIFLGMGMVNKSDINDINIVMIPVELNGRVFSVTVHIILVDNNSIFHSSEVWQAVYYLYSGIGARIERNIRKDMKASVVSISCDRWYEKLRDSLNKCFFVGSYKINDKKIIEYANKISFLLSLFIPYDYVKFEIDDIDANNEDSVLIYSDKRRISYAKIKNNIFFPKCRKKDKILGKIDATDFKYRMLEKRSILDNYLNTIIKSSEIEIKH